MLEYKCKRDCNIFYLWFDILEENGLPFMEKMVWCLILESMFSVLEKTANCLISESMFSVLEKTANRLFTESNLFDILE